MLFAPENAVAGIGESRRSRHVNLASGRHVRLPSLAHCFGRLDSPDVFVFLAAHVSNQTFVVPQPQQQSALSGARGESWHWDKGTVLDL